MFNSVGEKENGNVKQNSNKNKTKSSKKTQ
jgi:hypothetical protein